MAASYPITEHQELTSHTLGSDTVIRSELTRKRIAGRVLALCFVDGDCLPSE